MWTNDKQLRLNHLQQMEEQETLAPEEKSELQGLLLELEGEEWDMLASALQSLRTEQGRLQREQSYVEMQNAVLKALAQRYHDLLDRAKMQLESIQNEREWLRSEYAHILEEA